MSKVRGKGGAGVHSNVYGGGWGKNCLENCTIEIKSIEVPDEVRPILISVYDGQQSEPISELQLTKQETAHLARELGSLLNCYEHAVS